MVAAARTLDRNLRFADDVVEIDRERPRGTSA